MQPYETISDLKIGTILEVSGTAIQVELDVHLKELNRSFNGRVYAVGQMASIVKIHFGRRVIFAFVRLLRMKSEILAEQGIQISDSSSDSRVLEADLFGEGTWDRKENRLNFERGLKTYPLPQQGVFIATQEELQHLYQGAEKSQNPDGHQNLAHIGTYSNSSSTKCRANIDKLFGQHCAVLGSTGSGKSGTVAALIHSVLKSQGETTIRPRIIMIDPHGEYGQCFEERAKVFRAYNPVGAENAEENLLSLPYWLMSGDEFRSFLIGKGEHEATSQHNIVYRALSHARMVAAGMIEPAKDWVGKDQSADPLMPSPKVGFTQEMVDSFDRDLPLPFALQEFEKHIIKQQGVKIDGRSNKWVQKSPSDFDSHQKIIKKLTILKSDHRIKFMMKEYSDTSPDLQSIIEQFIGYKPKDQSDIRVIDISGLPNEVAGPLTALIARLLFQYKVWQTREEREKDPVLFVCEEAHRYVPSGGEAEYAEAQRAIQRIAKEGRKYGLGLMLVSQRPSDVDSTVISQCNSWIILRLTNASDQEHVRRYLPDNLAGITRILPSLARSEALFVGEAASIPARIDIQKLKKEQLPDSNDISFVTGWMNVPKNNDHIKTIADRWQKKGDA